MAGKSKQGAFEDLIEIAAKLPWWAGVLLALGAYLILHHYATAEIAQPTSAAQLGANVASQFGKTLAMFGQYLVPLAFLIGAGISAYGRHKRSALFASASASKSASAINAMTWQEFEMLVGEAFRRSGYSVVETGGGGADGGIDLVLRKDGEKYLVQCKQWRAFKVGVSIIRELYGAMAAAGAVGGFVVTSGVFTQEAKDFAAGRNIELVDGAELHEIIQQVQPAGSHEEKILSMTGQLCPKCGSLMVMRTAKHGMNIGKSFWGCPKYPQCRGTVPID
jgi:restriction system protein